MAIVACLLCAQTALAVDPWQYPSEKPDGKFGGGDGTEAAPFLIATAQQLADLAYLVNDGKPFKGMHFKLTADITLNDVNPSGIYTYEWTPIGTVGTFSDNDFEGYFDGGGHTISRLYLDMHDRKSTGLFGALYNAVVKDLTIEDSYLYGLPDENKAGMLAGYIYDTQIINCHVTNSKILAYFEDGGPTKTYVAGLVAYANISNFSGCSYSGNIKVIHRKGYANVSGLVGNGLRSTLSDCRTSGTMTVSLEEIKSMFNSKNIYLSGLCHDATTIKGCLNGMDFVVKDANSSDTNTKDLRLCTMCYSVNKMSQSANLGKITVEGVKGYEGILSNVFYTESCTMEDCAFYTIVEGTFNKGDFYGTLVYQPLGNEPDYDHTKRTILLDKTYFNTPNTKILSREDIDAAKLAKLYSYETNAATLKDNDEIFKNLNSGSQTMVWGRISDKGSQFYRCPLPLAAGGDYDNHLFSGKGTEQDPYIIGTMAELSFLAKGVSNGTIETKDKFFALNTDIDFYRASCGIGDTEANAFKGTFDGRGHVLSNPFLTNFSLFGNVEGTVKNLAVIDPIVKSTKNRCGVIVGNLKGGTLTGCYVGGKVTVSLNGTESPTYVGALCGESGATISNCYFKGELDVNGSCKGEVNIGGVAGYCSGLVNDSYASFTVNADKESAFTCTTNGINGYATGLKTHVANCYSVCDGTQDNNDLNGKRCANDSEIFYGYEFPAGSPWTWGPFRPVLKDAKCYVATAADGSDTEVYYDAIPLRDDKNPSNDICHYTLKDGEEDDKLLWALPNLAIYTQEAIYTPEEKSEFIINCTLDPNKPLNYNKKSSIDVKAVKVNMHYPLNLTSSKKYYTLCLPGTVKRSDFPFGSQLYIGGEVKTDNDGKQYMNIVQADSVAGGIPFVAYIPSAKTGDIINIVMRSRMAVEPLKSITDGKKTQRFSLTGTYKGQTVSNACTDIAEKGTMLYIDKVEGEQTLPPFTAWLDSEEKVELRNYLLLDETSNDIAEAIADNNGKNVSTMLKRELTQDKWNTICLPTKLQSDYIDYRFGQGTKLEQLSSVETNPNGGYTLVFSYATDIEPGKSYLIKPASVNAVYNLSHCDISSQLTPSEVHFTTDGAAATVKLCGTFERKALGMGDGDSKEECYTLDDKMCHATADNPILLNGFHCYITADDNAAKALAKGFVIRHADGSTTTGLSLVEVGTTADGKQRVYNLQGMEQNPGARQRGVYVKGGRKYVK